MSKVYRKIEKQDDTKVETPNDAHDNALTITYSSSDSLPTGR